MMRALSHLIICGLLLCHQTFGAPRAVTAAAGVLLLAPILAAVGAFAAILANLTIVVERVDE